MRNAIKHRLPRADVEGEYLLETQTWLCAIYFGVLNGRRGLKGNKERGSRKERKAGKLWHNAS